VPAKPYPSYKPSGVEWLGELPSEWDCLPLRRLVSLDNDKVEADSEMPLPYVGMENIEPWTGRLLQLDPDAIPEGISNRFVPGSVLFGKLRPYLAKASFVNFVGLCSSELLVLQSVKLQPAYLKYELLTDGFISLVDSSTYGAKMPRASWDFIGGVHLPVPPLEEQRGIAAFLDAETAKIDTLIEKKQALIEKLKEQRTALISRTVTRGLPPEAARAAGLDPHPRLKPSGVEWLGDVPEHWEVNKLKYLADVESGHTPSRSVPEYWIDTNIPWVSLNDSGFLRNHDYISETAVQISERGMANSSAHLLPAGAVVFSRDATVGLCAITTRPMAVSQHFIAYICGPRLLPRFLLLALKAMAQHLERLSMGSTIPTIGMPDIHSLSAPVPPSTEQEVICEYIDAECSKLDQTAAQVEAAASCLREYRSALITAAVTGKIDVRQHAS
jgi:type I restriction enzyme S subunit